MVEGQIGGVEEEHLADLGVQRVHAEGVDRGATFGVGDGQLQLDTVGVAGQVEDLLQLAVGQPMGSLRCRGHGRLPSGRRRIPSSATHSLADAGVRGITRQV
jgi:hypothetical protein